MGAPAILVWKGSTARTDVALTFDAGSDTGYAAAILDLLQAEGIPATFGMTGAWAENNPELVRRMANEGHVLMNHTYNHPHMETLTTAERLEQLAHAEAVVTSIGGGAMIPWFRPPFGAYNNQMLIDVRSAGFTYSVMWTVDSLGWQGLDPAAVTRRCLDGATNGAIYLMHVGSASTDYDALPGVIQGLRDRGYRFVTVPEVIS